MFACYIFWYLFYLCRNIFQNEPSSDRIVAIIVEAETGSCENECEIFSVFTKPFCGIIPEKSIQINLTFTPAIDILNRCPRSPWLRSIKDTQVAFAGFSMFSTKYITLKIPDATHPIEPKTRMRGNSSEEAWVMAMELVSPHVGM